MSDARYNHLKVLVVDDHMLIRTTVVQLLRNFRISHIDTAESGDDALAMMQDRMDVQNGYDLVFLDWNMPGTDGLEVLKRCRKDKRFGDTAFVMLTAEREQKHIMQALDAGATSYIAKPVSAETMEKNLKHIARWLDKRRGGGVVEAKGMLSEELKPLISDGIRNIFSSMFNVSVLTGSATSSEVRPNMLCYGYMHQDSLRITLCFSFDEDLLRPLLSQIYSSEFLQKRETYEDAAGEIVNILCNQIKGFLNGRGYNLELDLPQVKTVLDRDLTDDQALHIHFSMNREKYFLVDVAANRPL